jgi:hypothetical protein
VGAYARNETTALQDSSRYAVLAIAGATLVAHLTVSWRYGFFRDELYFIDCGRHPAFGYVDQPPLVPLLAAATQAFGHCLVLLRAVAGLAHALTVVACAALAGIIAEEARLSSRFARPMAAAAVALSPMFLGLTSTLNTTAFEPFAWTYIAYAVARAIVRDEQRFLVKAGLVAGLALEAKYAAPLFLVPLIVGVALGPSRHILFTRHAAIGAAVCTALALPSAIWQVAHGLPFLELLHAASHGKNVAVSPLQFTMNQLGVMNPVLAPMWVAGIGWCLVARELARLRFLAIAFAGVFLATMALHGKDYYVAPAYGVAFALGALFIQRYVRWAIARAIYLVLTGAVAVVAAPYAMPILDPAALAAYMQWLGARPEAQENNQKDAIIPQLHADMLGWRELEAQVAQVWRSLPPDERAKAAIMTNNYGEAGAINFYGPDDGLPRALSGHNQYWLWGPGGYDGSIVIRVGGDLTRYQQRCAEVTVAATFGVPYAMPYEQDRPILLCRGMHPDLRQAWPEFKHIE